VIERAITYDSGRVHVAFADGRTLIVEPAEVYEAWEFHRGDVHLYAKPS
jgi:hypothetical protein